MLHRPQSGTVLEPKALVELGSTQPALLLWSSEGDLAGASSKQ